MRGTPAGGRTPCIGGEGLARGACATHRTGAMGLVLTIAAAGATPLLRARAYAVQAPEGKPRVAAGRLLRRISRDRFAMMAA
jgi:hypothetical protein